MLPSPQEENREASAMHSGTKTTLIARLGPYLALLLDRGFNSKPLAQPSNPFSLTINAVLPNPSIFLFASPTARRN
jgi:hypothetical protein